MEARFDVPERPRKPRSSGRTHILDKGLGSRAVADLLEVAAETVDLVKLGWGTSAVSGSVVHTVAAYHDADLEVCLGGTLLEFAHLTGQVPAYERWIQQLGLTCVEVSDGAYEMQEADKLKLIESFAADYVVYSEVGSKDAEVVVSPYKWVAAVKRELEAGATAVILEGRETGTAGLYRTTGEIRMGLVDELLESGVPPARMIFEAPEKKSQAWLMEHVGYDVNLANIRPEDALAVETLRLGLRADTLLGRHGK